jgi:hypothetical protein
MKNILKGIALFLILATGLLVFAQEPVVDIGRRHGNLQAAQEYITAAYQRIEQAQVDNRGHLGGHAARAKALLTEADEELRLAADTANERR